MSFGLFEASMTSEDEAKIASMDERRKFNAAVYDVTQQFGDFLASAPDLQEFKGRVALCKDEMMRTVNKSLPPVVGTMNRVVGTQKKLWCERQAAKEENPTKKPKGEDKKPHTSTDATRKAIESGDYGKVQDSVSPNTQGDKKVARRRVAMNYSWQQDPDDPDARIAWPDDDSELSVKPNGDDLWDWDCKSGGSSKGSGTTDDPTKAQQAAEDTYNIEVKKIYVQKDSRRTAGEEKGTGGNGRGRARYDNGDDNNWEAFPGEFDKHPPDEGGGGWESDHHGRVASPAPGPRGRVRVRQQDGRSTLQDEDGYHPSQYPPNYEGEGPQDPEARWNQNMSGPNYTEPPIGRVTGGLEDAPELIPEGNFDAYLDRVDQGGPEKVQVDFGQRTDEADWENTGRHAAVEMYSDFCDSEGLPKISKRTFLEFRDNVSEAEARQIWSAIVQADGKHRAPPGTPSTIRHKGPQPTKHGPRPESDIYWDEPDEDGTWLGTDSVGAGYKVSPYDDGEGNSGFSQEYHGPDEDPIYGPTHGYSSPSEAMGDFEDEYNRNVNSPFGGDLQGYFEDGDEVYWTNQDGSIDASHLQEGPATVQEDFSEGPGTRNYRVNWPGGGEDWSSGDNLTSAELVHDHPDYEKHRANDFGGPDSTDTYRLSSRRRTARSDALDNDCPVCEAGSGDPCDGVDGYHKQRTGNYIVSHTRRGPVLLAKQDGGDSDCPTCDAGAGDPCLGDDDYELPFFHKTRKGMKKRAAVPALPVSKGQGGRRQGPLKNTPTPGIGDEAYNPLAEGLGSQSDTAGDPHFNPLQPGGKLPVGPKMGRRRVAEQDERSLLDKADKAITDLLNQRAQTFQDTLGPLQQALQAIQYAEQVEQTMAPMGVGPPAGTIDVMPGQDPAQAGALGAPQVQPQAPPGAAPAAVPGAPPPGVAPGAPVPGMGQDPLMMGMQMANPDAGKTSRKRVQRPYNR